jgi:hypothetical protein
VRCNQKSSLGIPKDEVNVAALQWLSMFGPSELKRRNISSLTWLSVNNTSFQTAKDLQCFGFPRHCTGNVHKTLNQFVSSLTRLSVNTTSSQTVKDLQCFGFPRHCTDNIHKTLNPFISRVSCTSTTKQSHCHQAPCVFFQTPIYISSMEFEHPRPNTLSCVFFGLLRNTHSWKPFHHAILFLHIVWLCSRKSLRL